jgi:hypothetical protein
MPFVVGDIDFGAGTRQAAQITKYYNGFAVPRLTNFFASNQTCSPAHALAARPVSGA